MKNLNQAPAIIETRGLRRTFRSRKQEVTAVDGVDLTVRTGEVFGFLGPNGAGKTTTLRMLATLLEPTGGQATVAGCDLTRDQQQVRQRIGYVAQGGSTDPALTGRSELQLQGRLYGMSKQAAHQRAQQLIETLELQSCADRTIATYSGGQKRRLDLALGLIHKPRLVFLDEPTTGLDPQGRARMWDEVRRLRNEGTTIFLTTHYLEEADALCDRLAIIDHGRIVAEGTADELKRQIAGDVVSIGIEGDVSQVIALLEAQPFVREISREEELLRVYVDRGEVALPTILRLLDGAGMSPNSISLTRPTLDDVFLRQTGRSLREAEEAA